MARLTSLRPTVRTVAEAAGVSHQTVSRVLRGDPGVSPDKRARVIEEADRLNYRPSSAARALSRGRSNIVSLVAPYRADELFEDPHLLEIIHGAARALTARKQRLMLSIPLDPQQTGSVFDDLLSERIADGLIVEAGLGESGFDRVMDSGYPMVVVGYTTLPIASVRPDDEGGMYAVAQHLLALGHRRFGLVDGPASDRLALEARRAGIVRALADASAGAIVAGARGDFGFHSGASAAEAIMATRDPPTAIIAMNDRMAMGAMDWLSDHGFRVPSDISVTGFDGTRASARANPPLTTVRTGPIELGEKAVELLLDSGLKPAVGAAVLPTQLVVRSSTAPKAKRMEMTPPGARTATGNTSGTGASGTAQQPTARPRPAKRRI